MSELPRQLLAWIAGLLPKQKNEGDGGFQVGKISGPVTVVNVFQQREGPAVTAEPKAASLATAQQREVLTMIRRLRNSEAVFDFMERTFNTRMVIDLQPGQLLRVRRYVEAINRRNAEMKKEHQ